MKVHYQFTLAGRLGYVGESEISKLEQKIIETEKVLGALIRSLRKS